MSVTLGRETIAALDLDADVIQLLAQTSLGAATARQRDWSNRRQRAGEQASRQRSILPRLNDDDLLLAHATTFFTMSAAYSLLLDEAGDARGAYLSGSELLSSIGNEEAGVLAICAGRYPDLSPRSGWLNALMRTFSAAIGEGPGKNERQPAHTTSQTSPVLNVPAESLDILANRMVEAAGQDTTDDATGRMLEELLTELARPVDRLIGSAGWREQTTELLPVEPELLAVAIVATTWSRQHQGRRLDVNSLVADVALSAASALLG